MPGLCESADCAHLRPKLRRYQSTRIVEPPRCSQCRQRKAEAVRRDATYREVRLCDECFGDRVKRAEELKRRAQWNRPFRDYEAERALPATRAAQLAPDD
jgi:hypothetical protein